MSYIKEKERERKHESDEESVELNIEHFNKQLTTHVDFDIKYHEDQANIIMYVELDTKNINNLIKVDKMFDDQRRFYKNCIFLRKIQTPSTHIKGNFQISYVYYKGLTFTIQLNNKNRDGDEQPQIDSLYAGLKIYYKHQESWQHKWVRCENDDGTSRNSFQFEISKNDSEKILKQKLLLVFTFDKKVHLSEDYLGLQNQGNTCYANSTLQLFYHFLPLRKMVMQIPNKKLKPLTKALQQIFVDLMTEKYSAVRAQSILKCFEKVFNSPYLQQDVNQFLTSFFEQLEKQVPQSEAFWTGKQSQRTFSKTKEYSSKQQHNFNVLNLSIADSKGNHFESITQSLEYLVQESRADQPIDTDQYGKIQVYKVSKFQQMPTVLFMSLKRYGFNATRRQLTKINLDISYPKEINLDFLVQTPQGLDYVLYGVIVHKGKNPNSGHYFCFINVSKDPQRPSWYEFNDDKVRKAKQDHVLKNYTGKKKKEVYLNQQYGKWVEREAISEETAYLLVYLHKDRFQGYQTLNVELPNWQLQRIQQKLTREQAKTMASVKIFIYRKGDQFRPFLPTVQLMKQVKLLKDQLIQSELRKLEKLISCRIGAVWKVNIKTRTIKHIHSDYGEQCRITVRRHTEGKRGIRQPDYFLIIPEQITNQIEDNHQKKLVILHIIHQRDDEQTEETYFYSKQDGVEKLKELKNSGMNIQYNKEEMQYFKFGWNDYLQVTIS